MQTLEKVESTAPGLEQAIARQILQRTWGRISRLRVNVHDDRIVVHGHTATYYAKQLALEAALETLGSTDVMNVELDIHVSARNRFANRLSLS
jgi:BON domain